MVVSGVVVLITLVVEDRADVIGDVCSTVVVGLPVVVVKCSNVEESVVFVVGLLAVVEAIANV